MCHFWGPYLKQLAIRLDNLQGFRVYPPQPNFKFEFAWISHVLFHVPRFSPTSPTLGWGTGQQRVRVLADGGREEALDSVFSHARNESYVMAEFKVTRE